MSTADSDITVEILKDIRGEAVEEHLGGVQTSSGS